MNELKIYHNPRCSKSRETLKLIINKKLSPKIIHYLDEKLTFKEVNLLLDLLQLTPRSLLRSEEVEYRNNNLKDPKISDDEIINYMIQFPKLIQRPIVINCKKAIIGRPPENVLKILRARAAQVMTYPFSVGPTTEPCDN